MFKDFKMNHPGTTICFVFKLIDRGLTIEEIDDAMVKAIGPNWRVNTVAQWLRNFREKGFISRESSQLSVDDLQAIVMNSLKADRS